MTSIFERRLKEREQEIPEETFTPRGAPFSSERPSQSRGVAVFEREAQRKEEAESRGPPEEEGFLAGLGRRAGALATRGGEALLGGAGALQQLAHAGVGKAANLLGSTLYHGGNVPELPSEETVFDFLEKGRVYPTPGEIREKVTKPLTGEYLEPRGEGEKTAQELAGDIGGMFFPGGPIGKLAKIGIPFAGQLGKQAVKASGGSESQQDLAKLGVMGIFSIAHLGDAKKHAVKLMNEAEALVPTNTPMNPIQVMNRIRDIKRQEWYKGINTSSKKPAKHAMDYITSRVKSNKLDVHNAIQIKKDINETLRNLGSFDVKTKPDIKAATKYLNQVKDALDDGIKEYGKKNPQFLTAYKEANQAYAVTEKSGALSNFIQKHYTGPALSNTTKGLLGTALLHGGQYLPAAAGVAASTAPLLGAAHMTFKVAQRMGKSPALRKYYVNVLTDAAKGNAVAMSRNLQKLDKKIKEEEARGVLLKP